MSKQNVLRMRLVFLFIILSLSSPLSVYCHNDNVTRYTLQLPFANPLQEEVVSFIGGIIDFGENVDVLVESVNAEIGEMTGTVDNPIARGALAYELPIQSVFRYDGNRFGMVFSLSDNMECVLDLRGGCVWTNDALAQFDPRNLSCSNQGFATCLLPNLAVQSSVRLSPLTSGTITVVFSLKRQSVPLVYVYSEIFQFFPSLSMQEKIEVVATTVFDAYASILKEGGRNHQQNNSTPGLPRTGFLNNLPIVGYTLGIGLVIVFWYTSQQSKHIHRVHLVDQTTISSKKNCDEFENSFS